MQQINVAQTFKAFIKSAFNHNFMNIIMKCCMSCVLNVTVKEKV